MKNIQANVTIRIKIDDHDFELNKEEATSLHEALGKALGIKNIPSGPVMREVVINERNNDLLPLPKSPYYPKKPPYEIPEVWCKSGSVYGGCQVDATKI